MEIGPGSRKVWDKIDTVTEKKGLLTVYDEVAKCNRCGFCQAQCPIYSITGAEASVARGHNAHIRGVIEQKLDFTEEIKAPLFECLLCRACVANCFPAIKTDDNVIAARTAYVQRFGQSRLLDFIFYNLLPNPKKMAFYLRLAATGRNNRLIKLAESLQLFKWFGRGLDQAIQIIPAFPKRFLSEILSQSSFNSQDSARPGRCRVAYFIGCGVNYTLPEIGEATLKVLRDYGCQVEVVENNCCGLPPLVYGNVEAARLLARKNIDMLQDLSVDAIVTDCGSCASFLKDYPKILAGEENYGVRASKVSEKVQEFSQFIQSLDTSIPFASLKQTVTYHDPCHMSRYQQIMRQPRELIANLPGVDFKEMPEADWCCGAAGAYNVSHFEQSMKILDRKIANIVSTGAEIVVTSCPACVLQLNHGITRNKAPTKVFHLSQLLADYLRKIG